MGFVANLNADTTTLEGAKKACDGGDMSGCFNLGAMYDNGEGVKQDDFKAVKLYTKACDSGVIRGCHYLGLKYVKGEGVKQSNSKAKELFAKACDGGDTYGCKNYAKLNKR